ncbi:MAG: hypothetical protein LEGION0398_MBIBDBAK_00809 [Legionellaceae bacterium]
MSSYRFIFPDEIIEKPFNIKTSYNNKEKKWNVNKLKQIQTLSEFQKVVSINPF